MLKSIFKLTGLKLALLITLVMLGLFLYGTVDPTGNFLNLLDKKWVDFIIKERGVQPHTTEVAIATIDSKSVDYYGRWPWPRARMAQLMDALNNYYKVNTIGLDIVFSEPEDPSGIAVTQDYTTYFRKLGFTGSKAAEFVKRPAVLTEPTWWSSRKGPIASRRPWRGRRARRPGRRGADRARRARCGRTASGRAA